MSGSGGWPGWPNNFLPVVEMRSWLTPNATAGAFRDDHSVIPEKGELVDHAHGCHPGAGAP